VFGGSNSSLGAARKLLLESLRSRGVLASASLTFMGVSALTTAGYAWLVGPVLIALQRDSVSNSSPVSTLQIEAFPSLSWTQIVGAMVLLGLARAAAETGRAHLTTRLQLGLVYEFRGKILSHVLRVEPGNLAAWPPGELASRIQVEVHGVRALLHFGVIQGIRSILVATALAIVAIRVDSALAIPGLLLYPFAVALVVWAARPARQFQRGVYAAESAVVSDTVEAIDGASVLRAYGATARYGTRIDAKAALSAKRALHSNTWGAGAGPLVELAGAVAITIVAAVGWSRAAPIDLPSTGAVLAALLLMYRPLRTLAQSVFSWSAGLSSLDRLDQVLRLPTSPVEGSPVRTAPVTSLALRDVHFGYDGRPVLNGVSMDLRAGEWVAITGPSGAGKSTLLALLGGLLEPSEGEVQIDGEPTPRGRLCASVAWMPQTPALFRDTLLQNIALGDAHPDRAGVVAAARQVDAHDFIGARQGGYDGRIREGGTDLSVGQRHRISLARALYRGAPTLLLDEPTAALDDAQERNVMAVCRKHADAGGLVVVATHRQDLLRRADRVLEVRNGNVSEWERPGEDALLN